MFLMLRNKFTSGLTQNWRYLSTFVVEPSSSLVSERVKVFGTGFKPFQELTIKATLKLPSEKLNFLSYAHIKASKDGTFDLSETESLGGSYLGVDSMGIFWSMTPEENSNHRLQLTNGKTPLRYLFHLYENFIHDFDLYQVMHDCKADRHFSLKEVRRIKVKDGNLRGTMFIPPGEGPFPAIITIQGGTKHCQVAEDPASILANKGFITLALAFFNVDDLPKFYSKINLEYFEEALEFLSEHKLVNSKSIGVYGSSKGVEIAFGMMSHFPNIAAVVTLNGSVACTLGEIMYKGFRVECMSSDMEAFAIDDEKLGNIRNVLGDPRDKPSSIFPFYRSNADLLMIVGLDDDIMHSDKHADIAKDLMDATGKTNYKILRYNYLGHLIDAPYSPICIKARHEIFNPYLVSFGGRNKMMNADAQINVWKNVIDFFKRTL